jgi:hypothetical protein
MSKLKTMNQRGDGELRKAVAELRKAEGASCSLDAICS